MKRTLFTLLLLITGLFQANAQQRMCLLKVRLTDNGLITIAIDDRYYNKHGRAITVNDLPAGRHFLKVYSYEDNNRSRRIKARLLYQGTIRIEKNTVMTCLVDPYRGSISYNVRDLVPDYQYEDDPYEDYDNHRDRKRYDDTYDNGLLTQRDMSDLKQRVDDRITDTDKMKLMQSVLESRYYTTEQVRELMRWLSFESSKLDFAKWAYKNVTDRKNYWKLDNEFTFSSSKDEFNDYIRSAN